MTRPELQGSAELLSMRLLDHVQEILDRQTTSGAFFASDYEWAPITGSLDALATQLVTLLADNGITYHDHTEEYDRVAR